MRNMSAPQRSHGIRSASGAGGGGEALRIGRARDAGGFGASGIQRIIRGVAG
jgi:hypothetical protein